MFRRVLSATLVSAAMVVAGPALAGPGGGHGGGVGAGANVGANVGAHGGMSGGVGAGANMGLGGQATRINSNASPNASFNRGTATTTTNVSGSTRTRVTTNSLPGLKAGATVQTSAGTSLGTVSRVVTDRNGNILQVFVTTSTGRTMRLSPTAFSMNGSVLVASNVRAQAVNSQGVFNASPTGIANASANSVLNRGSVAVTALPGLATGLTVMNANNVNIGTVSRVVTDRAGNVRVVFVTNTSTGATFRLMPSTLTISGSTVTTTSTVGG